MALLLHSLLYGALLTVGLIAIMIVSYAWKPGVWVDDYPPDVRARYYAQAGPMDEATKRMKLVVAAPFFLFMIVMMILAVRALPAGLTPNFVTVFACAFL